MPIFLPNPAKFNKLPLDFNQFFSPRIGRGHLVPGICFSMIFHVFMRNSQFSNKKMLYVRKFAFLMGKYAILYDDSSFGN